MSAKKIFLLTLLIILVLPFIVQGQRKQSAKILNDSRLLKDKPTIYITFERSGKRKPLFNSESDKGIWLRLHNNTKWSIRFCTFALPEDWYDGEVGMPYEIEKQPPLFSGSPDEIKKDEDEWKKADALGYNYHEMCETFYLKSGKSVLFSAPREHFSRFLLMKVLYEYEWEFGKGHEPLHYAVFSYFDIPEKER